MEYWQSIGLKRFTNLNECTWIISTEYIIHTPIMDRPFAFHRILHASVILYQKRSWFHTQKINDVFCPLTSN